MIQFNPNGPQSFDENIITVLLKDKKGNIFLSKEMFELYNLIGKEADKLLTGIKGYDLLDFERTEFVPEKSKNNEYNFLSANILAFILENNKIILKNIKN